jgi:Predicted AAA-ATPase/PD-(D/E)XK nuclease superfamily
MAGKRKFCKNVVQKINHYQMETLKLLPIGVQTFKNMREENYVYVDKTEHIYQLASKIGYYFLSRPRRFGKSLMVSTLKELFEGNRKLFTGLWIEDKWDWSKTNPVIHLSFAQMGYKTMGLEKAILYELKALATQHNVVFSTDAVNLQFRELIQVLHEKHGKVVILVDEYDKPIIDYLEATQMHKAKENQLIMKTFYSVLKDAEVHIHTIFITGVSKFAKVSIFSDLNHLKDLTLDPKSVTIAGYTQTELEANFEPHIQAVMESLNLDRNQLLDMMKDWYNGYSWDGKQTLYNPFGMLNFFDEKVFRNYWFTTGTPTLLIKLMKEAQVFEFERKAITDTSLEKYDLDNLDLPSIMLQTGYLTIKEKDVLTGDMVLDYPNREVRNSMYQFILDDLARHRRMGHYANNTVSDLRIALKENDLYKVEMIINTLFADIPSNLYESHKNDPQKELQLSERFFHSIIHLLFKYLGGFIQSEVSTSWGRADSVVTTDTHIYIFEFKFNRTGQYALNQIIKNNYAEKHRASGKILVGIGVNFNHKTRNINGWKAKILD